ncbi:MAG: hypothetical protein Q9225_006984 [Loekoesia sp. 1 TL-2023]
MPPDDKTQFVKSAHDDAYNLAGVAIGKISETQGQNDNTRDVLFPDIQIHPQRQEIYRDIDDVYQRARTFHEMTLQDFNLQDEQVTLIYYCGNEGFQWLGPDGYPDHFLDTFSGAIYHVGHTGSANLPCRGPGDIAVTSPGEIPNANHNKWKFSIILCHSFLDLQREPTINDAIARYPSLGQRGGYLGDLHLANGASALLHEIIHASSFSINITVLPQPDPANLEEYYGFKESVDFAAQDGLGAAMTNIDNYAVYALSREMNEVDWLDGVAQRNNDDEDSEDEDSEDDEDEQDSEAEATAAAAAMVAKRTAESLREADMVAVPSQVTTQLAQPLFMAYVLILCLEVTSMHITHLRGLYVI